MKDKIFFSWQSDIKDSKTKLSQIIKDSIHSLQNENIELDVDFDRDTLDSVGALSIANVIFNKISNSSVFIADITTINSKCKGRKYPNPNVLTELGFAISKIGWHRIILILDEEYGNEDDVPFDLKGHRLVKFNSSKEDYKKRLTKEIKNILPQALKLNSNFNIVAHYLKAKIDRLLLEIFNKITRLFLDYKYNEPQPPKVTYEILSIFNKEDIVFGLNNHYKCNFEIFRSYENYISQIDQIILRISNDNKFDTEAISTICQISWKIAKIESEIRSSFTKLRTKKINKKNPDILNIYNKKLHAYGNNIYELREQHGKGYSILDTFESKIYLSEFDFFELYEYRSNEDLIELIQEIQSLILKWFKITGEYLIRQDGSKMYLNP